MMKDLITTNFMNKFMNKDVFGTDAFLRTFNDIFNDLDNLNNLMIYPLTTSYSDLNVFPATLTTKYNLKKIDDETYELEVPVVGFSEENIEITKTENLLTIKGKRHDENKGKYLYRGLKNEFSISFNLANDIVVDEALLCNGLLKIKLNRIIPEHKKPKVIKPKVSNNKSTEINHEDQKE